MPPRKKVHYRRYGEPAFWFKDTFTATKKRSTDEETAWLDKEKVAFNSLENFGLVRGDYRYVDLVDKSHGSICDYEKTSASFARQRLCIPEEYKFLDLNGVISMGCLCFFAQDYVRVVNNLLAAIKHGRPLDTEALEHLLFKKGRLLGPDVGSHTPTPRPTSQTGPHTTAPSEGGPGRRPKRTSDQISGTGKESKNELAGLEQPNKRTRGHPPAPANSTEASMVQSPASPITRTPPRTTTGGRPSPGDKPRVAAPPTTECETPGGKDEEGDDWDTGSQPNHLTAMSGIFQTRKGRYFGVCTATPKPVKLEKARQAVAAMGITPSFPIFDDLAESQHGLSKFENTTTAFVMRELCIRATTGVQSIGSVERGLTIFVLRMMASDLHRLVVGIRRIIMLGKGTDKDGMLELLYDYHIDYETSKRLVGTHISSAPLCDEPEWEGYMRRWNSRREERAQSAVELD